jgi:PAS domain S-box-containing protein
MMKKQRDTSLQIRLATITILTLLIALAAAAYLSGRQVNRDGDLIAEDAVPGTVHAHYMRMAISRGIGWVLVAGSAQSTQTRDAALKTVHEADTAFADALLHYEETIRMNPLKDRAMLERLRNDYAAFFKQRMAYEALVLAGDRSGAAAFMERELLPVFLPAISSAEEMIKYNHGNSIALSGSIRSSVNHLYWAVAVVVVLALACAVVLVFNLTVRRRELAELQENEEKFSKAFRANPSGIAITEIETGRYIEVNDSFCKILGYPPQEVIGYTTLDKGVWSSEAERSRILQPLFNSGKLRDLEIQTRTRYGVRKTLSLNAELIELAGRRCIVTLIEDITERRQLEHKQVELAAIVESSEDAIIGKTLTGSITSWNRGAEKIFGYTAAEAIGQPLQMLLPPERQHEEAGIIAGIARGETVEHLDTVRVRKDGREIFISATISPLRDGTGKVIGASTIARDITAQKRVEEALASSEVLLRHLIKHTPAAVAMFDTEMRYLQASDRWINDYHLEGRDVIGRSHYEVFPDLPEDWKEIHRRVLRGQTDRCDEAMFPRADGGVEWLQWEVRPWHAAENVIGGLIMFTQVITERKHTESKLRESEELFRTSFESATVGVCLVAKDGKFFNVNRTLCEMFGYTKEELLHLTFNDVTYEQDKEIGRSFLDNALAGGPKTLQTEKRYLHKDGHVVWAYLSTAVLDTPQEHGGYLISYVQDITQRKQAAEALASTTELLERTSAMAKVGGWELDLASQRVMWSAETARLHEVEFPFEQPLLKQGIDFYGPEAWPAIEAAVQAAIVHGTSYDLESPFITAKGNRIWVRVQGFAVIENGQTTKLRGTFQDITEQKQAELRIRHLNRIYAVLSAINQTIVHEKESQRMLAEACRIVVEKGGFQMAWVGVCDAAAQTIRPVASAGVVEGYLDQVNIDLRDKVRSGGPTGRCFLTGEHVTCGDMEHDPILAPWREEALKRGYRSSASFPLRVGGKVSGVFTLYSGQTGFFNEEEMLLLDELAMDIGFALEVSEGEAKRRQAEQELRWRTAFFEAQVHSAIDGILVVDSAGKKLLQNRRMNELWKIPPHIADDPDDSHQVQFVLDRVKQPQLFAQRITALNAHPDEIAMDEVELVDGTLMERYSAPVCGRDGTYYGRVWTFHDITDTRSKEIRFRRMFASNMQGVFFWKADGSILEANDAFLQYVGYTREELAAGLVNWRALTPPEYLQHDNRALEEVSARGICAPYEKEYLRKDGTRLPILLGAAVFEGSQEGVCFVLDLTERKKLEQQFLRAQRMESIGTLASGVAHDLNNILTPIMMSAPVLRMRISEDSREKIIDTIETSAARGAQIVKQVLTFGRGLEGEKHPLQIEMLMDEMEQMIRSTFPKDIALECVKAPQLWLVLGDATQLHQVLLNLCVNARDAMPEGGSLRLSAANLELDASYASMLSEATPGPYVVLEVSDTGTGIPPDVLERIFDPFFTTKGVGKGTGLGLSTVHGIVKSHGGLLKVITEPGQGTTFRIYLPAAPDQQAVADAASLAPPPAGHGELVLVVDDEAAITRTACTVLEANGYRVLLAGDATEALVLFTEHAQEVALVLTDIMMPIMSGVLFLRTLRKIKADVPVVASTGLYDQAQLATMKELGIETVLHKPYSSNTLLRTLHGVLLPKS